jgi:glycosyltransferase involved in cell wall biosynthesis
MPKRVPRTSKNVAWILLFQNRRLGRVEEERVLVAMRNASAYLPRCIESLQAQSFSSFHAYVVDDFSDDGSDVVARGLTAGDPRFEVVRNSRRIYVAGNYQQILRRGEIDDDDVVVTVDGDDWLPDEHVFARIVEAYADPEVWMTWGSFIGLRHGRYWRGVSDPVPDVTKLRTEDFRTSHLRTWKVFLWRAIRDEDLRGPSGEYWPGGADLAYLFPMLEMATNAHARHLPDVNYVYNFDNPLCSSTSRRDVVDRCVSLIRAKPSYPPFIRGPRNQEHRRG